MYNLKRLIVGVSVLIAVTGCSDTTVPVRISFSALYDGAAIDCSTSDAPSLTDLRFYVHDIEVADSNGAWRPLHLEAGSPWQTQDVALIDLENGEGACRGGSKFVRNFIEGTSAVPGVMGVRFTLGVPFELNHADPVQASSPLNQSVMHWHWQGGYKFLRAGLKSASGSSWLHLGSTECQGSVGSITYCNHPNRVTVELSGFDPTQHRVALQMDALFANVSLGKVSPSRCMAVPSEPTCAAFLSNLGLGDGGNQTTQANPVFTYVSFR